MECVDSSFIISIIWSSVLMLVIAQLRCEGKIKLFFKELYSPPILISFGISCIIMLCTYESLPAPKIQNIGAFLSRPAHFFESLLCNFNTTFNMLGIILPFMTVYSFLKEHYPEVLKNIKEKLGFN
jgi:hypothetical protein